MAQRQSGSDTSEPRQYLLRSPSQASDKTTRSITTAVPQASPAPAYVARDAATELIAAEIERPILVSDSALLLVNEFLDQVLYNILLASRSTTLGSLRHAVPTVLKPRLGKAAVRVAEEELREYINDDEEVELHARANGAELKHDFDPDLAWRLARLRCMVYTRLGDLEEEDEEDLLEKEGLRMQLEAAKRASQAVVETGPAAAIFLTSIVEYLGEQALYYAAQHAQKRHAQQGNQHIQEEEPEFMGSTLDPDDIIIGGKDMNHVGRDSPLSRLWRSYRRNTRDSLSRPMSPEARAAHGLGLSHSRATSSVPHESAILEERSPDQIPLPISGTDVDEIEVPGLAPGFSDDESTEDTAPQKPRRASMIVMPGTFPGTRSSSPEPPEIPERHPLRPNWLRKRSISSPIPTLGKPNNSNQISPRRNEQVSRHDTAYAINRADTATKLRRTSSSHEQRPSSSSETVFGGAAAAVASALGMGSLGISRDTDKGSKSIPKSIQHDAVSTSTQRNLSQKKTVAEEMLSPTPSVPPPKDAKTGSSITNMSDFASMHVPVAVSPIASIVRGTPVITPSGISGSGYFPIPPKASDNRTLAAGEISSYQKDGATDDLEGNLRPAPLRTPSGRVPTRRPGTSGSGRVATSTEQGTNTGVPQTPTAKESVFTSSAPASRPQSSGSAVLGAAVPAVPAPGTGRENPRIQHVKADSRGSNTGNSLESNRPVPSNRDSSTRSQAATQPRVVGISNEDGRIGLLPSALNINRDPRPSTSNSSTSKRFTGKPLPLGDESDEAKKKSLEILIRGNETLHYTLTPAAAMRDEQSLNQKARTPNQDMTEFLRNTSPRPQSSTAAKATALNSNLMNPPSSPKQLVQRIVPPSSPRGPVIPASPTRARNPLGEPRDPRTESSASVRDLADYARSTGPFDQKQLPQSLGPRAAPSPRLAMVTPYAQTPANEPSSPATSKASNRLKYQARDARPIRSDETSELIDFIREGPPNPGREHRIDRRVAPFRTTMDSEDFNNLAGGSEMVASLRESEDGRPIPSVDPSVNSQTPLIISNGQTTKGVILAAPIRLADRDEDEMPKRTRRRIKDPYAIYDSDDDDFEDEMASKNPRNQEESLMDFLRNTAPPREMTTQPILAARPGQRSTEQLRSGSSARETSPHLTQSGSRVDKYRPTQPTHAAHVERNRNAQTPNSDRTNFKKRFEARDAKATRTGTSELADYLKNSGPAPNAQYQPQPFILSSSTSPQPKSAPTPSVKEDNGIFKRFSRQRKK